MAKGGRPKAPLVLSEKEFMALRRWAMRSNTMRALALRARIVLECATGKDNAQVAKELGVSPVVVGRWRRRFVESRLEGLSGSPGSATTRLTKSSTSDQT
jgi:transposase-like protein